MNPGTIPVIMCTFNRPELFSKTLRMLERQTLQSTLYVLNNNKEIAADLLEQANNSQLPVVLVQSLKNIGGMGRFYIARYLSAAHPYVVMIDDDVILAPNALATLKLEAAQHIIASFWAYRFKNAQNYLDRQNIEAGDLADYCGTGGMVADSSIFTDSHLYTCPEEYWFIEDLWLSYIANHKKGWKLKKSAADITFMQDDGKNQAYELMAKKSDFLQYLNERGWQIGKARE